MVGMQEIVIGASPCTQWGAAFVNYQLLMGIGDAIPAIILCFLVGRIFFDGKNSKHMETGIESIYAVLPFVVIVGTIRFIMSYVGVIQSDIIDYFIPVTLWGYVLGLVFGVVYLLIETATVAGLKTMVLGIGMNWMIFNSFIGLIRKDAMPDALLRSAIDIVAIIFAIETLRVIMRRRLRRNLTVTSS